jgi:hypothetical protein
MRSQRACIMSRTPGASAGRENQCRTDWAKIGRTMKSQLLLVLCNPVDGRLMAGRYMGAQGANRRHYGEEERAQGARHML